MFTKFIHKKSNLKRPRANAAAKKNSSTSRHLFFLCVENAVSVTRGRKRNDFGGNFGDVPIFVHIRHYLCSSAQKGKNGARTFQ